LILAGAASSGVGFELALAQVVEQGLGQDAARRIVGAQKQDMERVGVGHFDS
jgi:hypothetical protein